MAASFRRTRFKLFLEIVHKCNKEQITILDVGGMGEILGNTGICGHSASDDIIEQ